jgi:hypothetical protein
LTLTPDVWHGPASVDPLQPFTPLRARKCGGRACLECRTGPARGFSFNTRIFAAPRWRVRRDARLRCRLRGPVTDPVIVAVLQYAGSSRERHYEGKFSCGALAEGVPMAALRDSAGRSLRAGAVLSHLFIGGATDRPGTVQLQDAAVFVGRC